MKNLLVQPTLAMNECTSEHKCNLQKTLFCHILVVGCYHSHLKELFVSISVSVELNIEKHFKLRENLESNVCRCFQFQL